MKKYNSIQIWSLRNYPSDLNVIISPKGRDLLKKGLLTRYDLIKRAAAKNNINYWTLIDNLRGRHSIDFFRLIRLIKKLQLDKNIIQKEVNGLVIRSIKIEDVHFPIQCDPIFASLFTNLLGDGGARNGNGSGYMHYGELESHQLIQEKLSYILGLTPYQKGESIPRVLVFLMLKYFRINNLSTKQSRYPKRILKADRLTRLASLTAFINDEGTINTSFIQIYSSNYKLLNGVRNVAKSLAYKVSKISCRKDKKVYLFRINSIKEFNKDYKILTKKYPEVRLLSRKERPLKILDLVAQKPKIIRSTEEIFKLIAPSLKNGPKTIYDLCETIQFMQSSLHPHLRKLINANLIKRKPSNSKTRFVYTLS